MKQEKSCGAVLYTLNDGEIKYLLVQTTSGHISFPKGHIEPGETEEETARREIFEETGLVVGDFFDGFRETYTYTTRKNNEKEVVYFLAPYDGLPVLQDSEILNSWLLGYDQSKALINRSREQEILTIAHNLLSQQ
ncbi:NUDIX domain-containing protein [Eubacteriales bacterium OttesenSCG-928-K08]|nr:NUDIX domain-containing protein [Eubacteriales bacterium OttesenSCG-928-K08]